MSECIKVVNRKWIPLWNLETVRSMTFFSSESDVDANCTVRRSLKKAQIHLQMSLCCSFVNGSNAKRRNLVGTYDCCVKEDIGDGCYRSHLRLKGSFCSVMAN